MEVDEVQTFQQQALEVRLPDENFDPTVEPQNGEEFLMHMIYERQHCPAVVVRRPQLSADLKTDHPPPTVAAKLLEELQVDPDVTLDVSLLPTPEWKSLQAANFRQTRGKIVKLRRQLAASAYDNALEPPLVTETSAWRDFCRQHQPHLSIILRLGQRTLEQLLVMLSEWLGRSTDQDEGEDDEDEEPLQPTASSSTAGSVATYDLSCGSDQWLGLWLYATLACLQLPLEPSVHSTLRSIARTCVRLRSQLKSHEVEKAIPYNLFIYLIAKEFDQLDLMEFV